MAHGPVHPAASIDSTVEKEKSAHRSSCERSTKVASGEFAKICTLLKPDLLEDLEACAKFVDGIGKVVNSSSFAKNTVYSCRSSLLIMMQKTMALAAESMCVNQDEAKAAMEMELLMVAKARLVVEKMKELESKLAVLKWSDVSTFIFLQLETTYLKVVDLKAKLNLIYKKYDVVEKEISCYIPQIQSLEGAV